MLRCLAMLAILALGQAVCAQTGEAASDAATAKKANSRDEYRPPTGFGGYTWNTPVGEFRKLAPDPVFVRIAYSGGNTEDFDAVCFAETGSSDFCSKTVGAGFHAMAEYYVDSQGFRLTDSVRKDKTVLFPISYEFCDHWVGFSHNVKGDMMERLRLCGVRLHFRSETAEQEQLIRDPEYLTASRRVLNWLIENHGEPEGYEREGSVIVMGLENPREMKPRTSRYDTWKWCSPKLDELTPRCTASVVFTFDSEIGRGQVIYLTGAAWAYAHARHFGGSEGDSFYRVLHGGGDPPPVQHMCTGSFLCEPPKPKPMTDKMKERFRLPTAPSGASPGTGDGTEEKSE